MNKIVTALALLLVFSSNTSAQWSSITSVPGIGTDGCFSVTVNGKGYVGAGNGRNALYEYDATANTWTMKTTVPGPVARAWAGSFVVNDKIYVLGGDSTFGGLLKDMWMYDLASDQWTKKADFPGGPRDGMFCWPLMVNSKIKVYAGGGFDGNVILGDFYQYDPGTDTWQSAGSLPAAMLFASTFIIDNKAYATMWEGGGFYNNTWEFDPSTGNWIEKTACPGKARGEGIGVVINGRGIVGLGQTDFNKGYTDMYSYNPGTDKWSKFSDTFPDAHTGWSVAFALGSTIYAGTGATMPGFDFGTKFYKLQVSSLDIRNVSSDQVFEVFPNPAAEMLQIRSGVYIHAVKLFDMHGKCVMDVVPDRSGTIDIGALDKGIYSVILYSEGHTAVTKVVVE